MKRPAAFSARRLTPPEEQDDEACDDNGDGCHGHEVWIANSGYFPPTAK
jgi:hypothetical protein